MTSSTGLWRRSGGLNPYGTKSEYSSIAGATYSYAAALAGEQRISLWWTPYSNRCGNVAVDIYDGAALLQTVYVNQLADGGQWDDLPGSYTFSATARVVVTSQGGCTTCADAVKWARLSVSSGNSPPEAVIETITPNPAVLGEEVIFEGYGTDYESSIAGYRWRSNIDDTLSNSSSFASSVLSAGIHTITFQVQDDDGAWSDPVTQILTVDNNMFLNVFPDENWQTATPESQGVNSTALDSALAYLNSNSTGVGSAEMVIVRNGYVIWQGASADSFHSIYSGTKAFTTTVLGLLIQEEVISSVNDPVVDYFPSLDDEYTTHAGITFKYLATFTSGYNADASPSTEMRWGDPRKFLTPTSPLASPGTRFQYFDPGIHQLGNILTNVSGDALENIFDSRIAEVIGMLKWEWQHYGYTDDGEGDEIVATFLNPSGIYGGGIHTTPLDLARFGLLYLNRGNWNGQQILNSDWVDEATTNQVPVTLTVKGFDRRGSFGYMWYTNDIGVNGSRLWPSAPPKTHTLRGKERNYCFVVPEWKMVISRMAPPGATGTVTDQIWEGFFNRLKTGISASPLP